MFFRKMGSSLDSKGHEVCLVDFLGSQVFTNGLAKGSAEKKVEKDQKIAFLVQFVCKIRISKLFKNRSLQNESSKNDISFSPFEKRARRWILKDLQFVWLISWAPKFLPSGWRKVLLKKSLELFKSGKTMVSQTSRIFTEIEIIVFFWPKLLFFWGGGKHSLSFLNQTWPFFQFPFFIVRFFFHRS